MNNSTDSVKMVMRPFTAYRQIFGYPMISMFLRTEDGARRAQPNLGNVFYYTTINQILSESKNQHG